MVEDEKSLSETIRLNLELEGYNVVTAGDGRSAVRHFKQERFNLIILDVMLPEMDGFTVCEIIRLENPEIPVLFLTAKNSSDDKIKGLKLGADDYLVKPFNLEELLLRTQILIRRSLQMQDKKFMRGLPTCPSNSDSFISFSSVLLALAAGGFFRDHLVILRGMYLTPLARLRITDRNHALSLGESPAGFACSPFT